MLNVHRLGRPGLLAIGCVLAVAAAAAGEADAPQQGTVAAAGHLRTERAEPWWAIRQRVETARRRLEVDIAELHAIAEAQDALVAYVESGGGADDDGLDRMLCHDSALRTLCSDLVETFGR